MKLADPHQDRDELIVVAVVHLIKTFPDKQK